MEFLPTYCMLNRFVGVCKVSNENLSQWMASPHWAVGKNVAVKAANFNKAQQFSTNAREQSIT